MMATKLFKKIENVIPLSLALKGDIVGFLGPGNPENFSVERVLILMDYLPQSLLTSASKTSANYSGIEYKDYDLLITHHPPLTKPEIPTYIIHSNWDVISGGACDALADILEIKIDDILEHKTGLGRIGNPLNGPVYLEELENVVMEKLKINQVRSVHTSEFLKNPKKRFNKIAVVSGFGLNPKLIRIAHEKGAEVFISGDLTHPGAILAKNLGIILIDATHHSTELPGLYSLGKLISSFGVSVEIYDTHVPWE